jgi:hypothetical protein
MARQTIPIAVRIRSTHAAEWKRLQPKIGIGALVRVLLDLYFLGKLDDLGIDQYVVDEFNYVKSVDKRS